MAHSLWPIANGLYRHWSWHGCRCVSHHHTYKSHHHTYKSHHHTVIGLGVDVAAAIEQRLHDAQLAVVARLFSVGV